MEHLVQTESIQGRALRDTARLTTASVSARVWVQLGMLALALTWLYAPVVSDLVSVWWTSDVYRHGFLVPFIAGYLAWRKRARLAAIELSPKMIPGLAMMATAGSLLLVRNLAGVAIAGEISLILMLPGLVLALAGWRFLKELALPLLYLLFMIPVLDEGSDWVHWPFQLLAANIAIAVLHVLGFAAVRQEEFIELPTVTLEVAEACSGIRFMISILAIGLPLAALTQRTWTRRVGLVLFAVLVGIIANGARVSMIGVLAYYGFETIKGPLHVLQAMFVAWIGYVALGVGAWFLGRSQTR